MRAKTKHITKVKDDPSRYKADFLFSSRTDFFFFVEYVVKLWQQ